MTEETAEQLAQRIQDVRGYIVVRSLRQYPVGQVMRGATSETCGDLTCKLVIIAGTDFSDWTEQHRLAGRPLDFDPYPFYYRVVAE